MNLLIDCAIKNNTIVVGHMRVASCHRRRAEAGDRDTNQGDDPTTDQSTMARPVTIKNEQLLKAAREEFLKHGIRATSAGIARRAGVSPGILFHRFGSKEALFVAAMDVGEAPRALFEQFDLKARVGKEPVRETLTKLGEMLLKRFQETVPSQLMAWANPDPSQVKPLAELHRGRGVQGERLLVAYLKEEMSRKRIRTVDPFVVVQAFGGALWFFAFEQATGANLRKTNRPVSGSDFVRQLVDTLWKGLQP